MRFNIIIPELKKGRIFYLTWSSENGKITNHFLLVKRIDSTTIQLRGLVNNCPSYGRPMVILSG